MGAVLGCGIVFGLLIVYLARERPDAILGLLALLGAGFGIDAAWRWRSGRRTATRSA